MCAVNDHKELEFMCNLLQIPNLFTLRVECGKSHQEECHYSSTKSISNPFALDFFCVVCDMSKILVLHVSLSLCDKMHMNCGHINSFWHYHINNSIAYTYVGLYLVKLCLIRLELVLQYSPFLTH